MGPFPTCKGPEGDKLQGTMPNKFFRIHFGTQYSKFKKMFWPNFEKVLFWPKFATFGPKMGEGYFFSKICFVHFSTFLYSQLHMPNFKKRSDIIGPFRLGRRPNKTSYIAY